MSVWICWYNRLEIEQAPSPFQCLFQCFLPGPCTMADCAWTGDVHEGSSVQHAGSDYADIDALKMMDMQAELFLLLTRNELLHVHHQLLI